MPPVPRVNPSPKESTEQARSRARLDAVGFVVLNLSQYRPSGISEGVPDTYAVHPGIGVACWVEHKRAKGAKVSPEQEAFLALHDAAHMAAHRIEASGMALPVGVGLPTIVLGATGDVDRFLVRLGLAEIAPGGQVVLYPMKTAAYYAWHRVRLEEKTRRQIARRVRKVTQSARQK